MTLATTMVTMAMMAVTALRSMFRLHCSVLGASVIVLNRKPSPMVLLVSKVEGPQTPVCEVWSPPSALRSACWACRSRGGTTCTCARAPSTRRALMRMYSNCKRLSRCLPLLSCSLTRSLEGTRTTCLIPQLQRLLLQPLQTRAAWEFLPAFLAKHGVRLVAWQQGGGASVLTASARSHQPSWLFTRGRSVALQGGCGKQDC